MSTLGVGIDLVEIDRVDRMIRRYGDKFLTKVLTATECAYCKDKSRPAQHVAARLAAKEAGYKALQVHGGARKVGWTDIGVVVQNGGRPGLEFFGRAQTVAKEMGVTEALVSLTHSTDAAAAVVILNG